jgi:hypothetical protein
MRKMAVLAALLAACDGGGGAPSSGGHGHQAPHGGTLVEVGDHFAQLELVVADGRITAYVLDGHAELGLRIEQRELVLHAGGKRVVLAAAANPLTGEKPGDTSQFDAPFTGPAAWDGEVESLRVKGQEFRGLKFKFPAGKE